MTKMKNLFLSKRVLLLVICFLIFAVTSNDQVNAISDHNKENPSVILRTSRTEVTIPCPQGTQSRSGCCGNEGAMIDLTSEIKNSAENSVWSYDYSTNGGRIVGSGSKVTLDLSGVNPGEYSITVSAKTFQKKKPHELIISDTVKITVRNCPDCGQNASCPTVRITCLPNLINQGERVFAMVEVFGAEPTYSWSLPVGGTISSENGSPRIEINTNNQKGKTITAKIELGGIPPFCQGLYPDTCEIQVK